jgi:hypothetical protein
MPRGATQLQIVRPAGLPADTVFWFWGRPLRVVSTKGTDAAAPVIVEELTAVGDAIAGQFSLWSLASVRAVMRDSLARAPLERDGRVVGMKGTSR